MPVYDPLLSPLELPVCTAEFDVRCTAPLILQDARAGRNPADLLAKSFKHYLIDHTCRQQGCGFAHGALVCVGECLAGDLLVVRSPMQDGALLPLPVRLLAPDLWRRQRVDRFRLRMVVLGRRNVQRMDLLSEVLHGWAARGLDAGGHRISLELEQAGFRVPDAVGGSVSGMRGEANFVLESLSPLLPSRHADGRADFDLGRAVAVMAQRLAEFDLADRGAEPGSVAPDLPLAVRNCVAEVVANGCRLDAIQYRRWRKQPVQERRRSRTNQGSYARSGYRLRVEGRAEAAALGWLMAAHWRGLGAQTGSGFGDVRLLLEP